MQNNSLICISLASTKIAKCREFLFRYFDRTAHLSMSQKRGLALFSALSTVAIAGPTLSLVRSPCLHSATSRRPEILMDILRSAFIPFYNLFQNIQNVTRWRIRRRLRWLMSERWFDSRCIKVCTLWGFTLPINCLCFCFTNSCRKILGFFIKSVHWNWELGWLG